jgi:hypothetical protein
MSKKRKQKQSALSQITKEYTMPTWTMTKPKPVVLGPSINERKLTPEDEQRAAKYDNSRLMSMLYFALSLKRPHNGSGEQKLLEAIAQHIPRGFPKHYDEAGNLHVDARQTEANRTLFVSHVDTVHRDDGVNAIKQTPSVWYASGSQLGADDGAGTAMLMHLLYHKVPAYYIFTVGEECGGVGAKVVSDDQALLKQFDRAIAFDRRNNSSVITHQGYGRCCSDAFAEALSDKFNDAGLLYMPDDGGVYTDTAEFVDVIPECTNISIGYMAEHTDREALDILHFRHLADAVLSFDWDNLPTERDPSVDEFGSGNNWWSGSLWGYGGAKFDDSYSWLKEDYPTQATGTYPATDTSTTWTDDDDLYCALEEAANRHDTGYLWSLLSDHIETYYGVTLPLSATINFKRADLHRWQKQVGQQPTEDILDEIAEQLTII